MFATTQRHGRANKKSTHGARKIHAKSHAYGSREELLRAAHKWVFGHGYAMTIKRSIPGKSAYLKCDRGGEYLPQVPERKRQAAFRGMECPFLFLRILPKKQELKVKDNKQKEHLHKPAHFVQRVIQRSKKPTRVENSPRTSF